MTDNEYISSYTSNNNKTARNLYKVFSNLYQRKTFSSLTNFKDKPQNPWGKLAVQLHFHLLFLIEVYEERHQQSIYAIKIL